MGWLKWLRGDPPHRHQFRPEFPDCPPGTVGHMSVVERCACGATQHVSRWVHYE